MNQIQSSITRNLLDTSTPIPIQSGAFTLFVRLLCNNLIQTEST